MTIKDYIYDYDDAVYKDVKDAIQELIDDGYLDLSEYNGRQDELREELYDKFWTTDRITGNGGGFYWGDRRITEAALCHNYDLLLEAMDEFGDTQYFEMLDNPFMADTTIRCYLLGGAISQALDDFWSEYDLES